MPLHRALGRRVGWPIRAGLVVGIVSASLSVVTTHAAEAATDTVTTCASSGAGSLPVVLGAAAPGDTVDFSVPCPPGSPIALTAPLTLTQDVTITGPGASTMAVSGNGAVQVFHVTSGVTAAISGITIEDGSEFYTAGGILNEGTLSVANATFTGNVNSSGYDCGAIDNLGGTMTVAGSSFTANSGRDTDVCNDAPPAYSGPSAPPAATTITNSTFTGEGSYGAPLSNEYGSSMVISGSTFTGDGAGHGAGVIGSGVAGAGGVLSVTNSVFSGNAGGDGGVIQIDSGSATIHDSTFTNNIGTGRAGAIDIADHDADCGPCGGTGTVVISGSTFSGNQTYANDGGAILNGNAGGSGTVTVSNSTFTGNFTGPGLSGGAIANEGGTMTVTNSTVSGNAAGTGGQGDNIYNTATLDLGATIVANPSAAGDCALGTYTDLGYNLSDDGSCAFSGTGDLSATPAGLDPAGLQDNGGATQTIGLASGSAAIDHVANATLCPVTDQRGVARATPCDVGAFDTDGATAVITSYSCLDPSLGLVTLPVSITQAPAPPTALGVPGTFNSTLDLTTTVPPSVVDAERAHGVTQVTFDAAALTVAQDGGTAFTTASQQTLADNLPVVVPYVAGTPASYTYVFNPLTWTSGPGSGVASFHPTELDVQIDGNAGSSQASLQCFPPGPQAAAIGGPSGPVPTLATVTVSPPAPTPTLQVPATVTPELQQVTVGSDALWDVTVTNASSAAAHGVVLSVAAATPSAPLSFDLTAMAGSGSTCVASGAPDGHITCALGTVGPGAHPVINAIAKTTGLAASTTLAGTLSVTSADAPTVSGTLGSLTAEVIANTVITAVVPGVTVVNTTTKLSSTNPVGIKLKTPKKVLTSTLLKATPSAPGSAAANVPARRHRGRGILGFASASTAVPPPVSSIVGGIPTTQDNLLCPPTAPCYGSIALVNGNFSSYSDQTHPIQVLTTFFVGLAKSNTTLWMDKGNGTVRQLGVCTKAGKLFHTPCYSKTKTIGPAGKQSIRYTILFVGTDPRFGLR